MAWLHGSLKFAAKPLGEVSAKLLSCLVDLPDRDRTDDLFHAMEARSPAAPPEAHSLSILG